MYGNVLSASAVERMIDLGTIKIEPFDLCHLGLAHYRLHPERMYEIDGDSDPLRLRCTYDRKRHGPRLLVPAETYVLIEIHEQIVLPDGMFGRIVSTSFAIERGLSLEAGKLDAGYGDILRERTPLLVGLRNNLRVSVEFAADNGIAHLEIVDLRGTETRFGGFSDETLDRFRERTSRFTQARDDGVHYE